MLRFTLRVGCQLAAVDAEHGWKDPDLLDRLVAGDLGVADVLHLLLDEALHVGVSGGGGRRRSSLGNLRGHLELGQRLGIEHDQRRQIRLTVTDHHGLSDPSNRLQVTLPFQPARRSSRQR